MSALPAVDPQLEVITVIALRDLVETGHVMAVYDLVQISDGKPYKPFSGSVDVLTPLGLLDQNGSVPSGVQQIVRAHVRFDGLEVTVSDERI